MIPEATQLLESQFLFLRYVIVHDHVCMYVCVCVCMFHDAFVSLMFSVCLYTADLYVGICASYVFLIKL